MKTTFLLLLLFFGISMYAQESQEVDTLDFTGEQYLSFTPRIAFNDALGVGISADFQKMIAKKWSWGISYDLMVFGGRHTEGDKINFIKNPEIQWVNNLQGRFNFRQNLGTERIHFEAGIGLGAALITSSRNTHYLRPTASIHGLLDFRVGKKFHLTTGLIPIFFSLGEGNTTLYKANWEHQTGYVSMHLIGLRWKI